MGEAICSRAGVPRWLLGMRMQARKDEDMKCMLNHYPFVTICGPQFQLQAPIHHWFAVAPGVHKLLFTRDRKDSPKDSHSHTSLTSFNILTPRNQASLHLCSGDNPKSVHRTAPGFGTSSCPRNLASACTSPIVSFDVAVMKGFSYTALGS